MRKVLRVVLPVLAYLLYWTLGLPWYLDLAVALVALPLLVRAAPAKSAALLVSLLLSLALVEVAVRALAPGVASVYRDHEKWRHDNDRYERNVVDTIAQPYGDLVAMMPSLARALSEPRSVDFRTDSEGLRNGADYHGQALVLVGDSFVVGNGNTQANTLPEVLRSAHGLDTYSIAYPGDPLRYFHAARLFLAKHPDVRFLFFFFEGNDFEPTVGPAPFAQEPNGYDVFRSRIRADVYPGLRYPSVVFNVSRNLERELRGGPNAPARVVVHELGGRPVGFLSEFIRIASAPDLRILGLDLDPKKVVAHTAGVFFIPTKYRVYKPWIDDGVTLPEPSSAFAALRAFYSASGVPLVDLTPALRRRAGELLPEGKCVFWRDDTHWNEHGIRAAAEEVARVAGAR